MRKPQRRYTDEEKKALVKKVDHGIASGMNVTQASRAARIPDQSYRMWKKRFSAKSEEE